MATSYILVFFVLLQLKHFIFDWFLQTPYETNNKGQYFHPGGISHATKHCLGTMAAAYFIAPEAFLYFGVLDGLVHYHIDWAKKNLISRLGLTSEDKGFWVLMGLDQLLHQLTYLGLIYLLLLP